ncbi:neurensin-1-like [Argonauta hians]
MENVTSTEATAGSFEDDADTLNAEGHRNSSLASTRRLLFKTVGKQDSNDLSRDYIGVKSYLHYFYESPTFKDPSIYEEEDSLRYLLNPQRRRRRCPPIWWKIFLWLGANLLFFGIVGILVGYLVPQRKVIIDINSSTKIAMVDRDAERYNKMLDVCKVIGLILFCAGGAIFSLSLLFPSFFTSYCEDDIHDATEESFQISVGDMEKRSNSSVEMTIPVTAETKSVQPNLIGQSVIVTDDLIKMKD